MPIVIADRTSTINSLIQEMRYNDAIIKIPFNGFLSNIHVQDFEEEAILEFGKSLEVWETHNYACYRLTDEEDCDMDDFSVSLPAQKSCAKAKFRFFFADGVICEVWAKNRITAATHVQNFYSCDYMRTLTKVENMGALTSEEQQYLASRLQRD